MQILHADLSVSITELKRNPSAILAEAQGEPVAVLNHNKAEAYLVPALLFDQLIEIAEDYIDSHCIQERMKGEFVEVALDEL